MGEEMCECAVVKRCKKLVKVLYQKNFAENHKTAFDIRVVDTEKLQGNSKFTNDQIDMNLSNAKPDSGDENGCSVTNYYVEETSDSVTNECGDEKSVSGENNSGEEKSGMATNVCGEEKDSTGTNASGEEKNNSVTNVGGEEKSSPGTNVFEEENEVLVSGEEGSSGKNASGEEKGGSVRSDCGEEKGGFGTKIGGEEKGGEKLCGSCGSKGSFQRCSRCKSTFYCSKACQKKDWPTHKGFCKEKFTSEEKIKATHKEQERKEKGIQKLSVDQVLLRATRPADSLQKAERLARVCFPIHDIRTYFKDIPLKQASPSDPFPFLEIDSYVLVAFVDKYHEHGIHIMDAEDNGSKVVFYLDDFDDNQFPSFSFSPQVKPGDYICLVDPVMHVFRDGTFGIRINNPAELSVLNI